MAGQFGGVGTDAPSCGDIIPGREPPLGTTVALCGTAAGGVKGTVSFGGFLPLTEMAYQGDGSFLTLGDLALGDLDGDHQLDLVAADHTGGIVDVLLGRGDGTLAAATAYATGSPRSDDGMLEAGPSAIALGDVDGDGTLDIVAANTWAGTVSVLVGEGDATYRDHVDYAAGSPGVSAHGPFRVALGDLNGDGLLDIASANTAADTVSVLVGKGDGTFGPRRDMRLAISRRRWRSGT